jgi:nucleotide-binding universal stress UspA family protein
MSLPKTILMATDFSELANQAAERAIELAALADANLEWTHSVEVPAESTPLFGTAPAHSPVDQARKIAAMKVDEWVKRAEASGLRSTGCCVEGSPAKAVADRAAAIGADLIVVGSHGYTGLQHTFVGSVAERIVREAGCSVLVSRNAGNLSDGRSVVVGDDLSPSAAAARGVASSFAAALGQTLRVVHALEAGIPYLSTLEVLLPKDLMSEFYADARERLDAISRDSPDIGAAQTEISSEPPATAICDAARKYEASLIVVGTHGRRGAERFLLGSVAERVLRHAHCSVLVARSL